LRPTANPLRAWQIVLRSPRGVTSRKEDETQTSLAPSPEREEMLARAEAPAVDPPPVLLPADFFTSRRSVSPDR